METKVSKIEDTNNFPAGLFSGTEVFSYLHDSYALHEGRVIKFEDLPGMIKRVFISAFIDDKKAQHFYKTEMQIEGFESQFKQWLFCKFGSIDNTPDFLNGVLSPDTYNSVCKRKDCHGRGCICGTASNLRSHEISTLIELMKGNNAKEVANTLNISIPGTISRINKLKEKLNSRNMAALAANAATIIGMIE